MKTSTVITSSLSTPLTIAFIILKLCKIITWRWIWVLAPMWVPIAFYLVIFGALYNINAILEHREYKKYRKLTVDNYGRATTWIPEAGIILDKDGKEPGYKVEEEAENNVDS